MPAFCKTGFVLAMGVCIQQSGKKRGDHTGQHEGREMRPGQASSLLQGHIERIESTICKEELNIILSAMDFINKCLFCVS